MRVRFKGIHQGEAQHRESNSREIMATDTPQDLESPVVCIRCFGRSFAKLGTGISNSERGQTFFHEHEQSFTNAGFHLTEEESCQICNGVFLRLNDYADELLVQSQGIEFYTFLIGSKFPAKSLELEEKLQSLMGESGEPLKREFNRELGKIVADLTGKEAEFKEPDLNIVVDLNFDSFRLKSKNLFIYGIYRKKRRDIPQTRWIHRRDVEESIETIIGDRVNLLTEGKNYFLHGGGREDVDVMMLGNGREFILESQEPKVRTVDLVSLANSINLANLGVEVENLSFVERSEVSALKARAPDKSYRVRLKSASDIIGERLNEATEKLTGKHIYQRTPLRVSTRRSDLVRDKQIKSLVVEEISGSTAVISVRAEAGTYIKELIHGDQGRTTPSLSEAYGEQLTVESLDVIWIHRNGE